ncbi:cytochrome C oxidase subunit IV family protein [Aeoliella mucimassa]|uniref:Oxidase n=1 Tax=Aeoliella mucimassa TaxID=2527972 RepID=A0A518AGY3_9BACT|nr:cytochrome C oxidase subunit IV family protein [Aeoliella mucimassa]QDU53986.1 hypothetical protein Pan181_01660 [Aeoliella mucimassa]
MSDNHHHYITPLPVLLGTFLALVALTILTVFQATQTMVDFGQYEVGLTLLIATAKALLVGLIFMQLAHDKPINGMVLMTALVFVGLFLSITLMDTKEYRLQQEDFRIQNPQTAE